MNTIGRTVIRVEADTRGFETTARAGIERGLRGVQSVMASGLARVGRDTADALTSAVSIGAAAAGAMAVSLGRVGAEYNTIEQRSLTALTTLLDSEEAAKRMLDQVREFASTSPFPRQAFLEATQQLIGFGLEAEKVVPTLSAIQDAVAATGGSTHDLSEIVRILAQVTSTGKISAVTLNQLGIRGIDAAQMLGDAMGKTAQQIREDISDGAIDAAEAVDLLVAQMTKRFGGAAAGLKETWVGATDRVKAAWRDMGSTLVDPFISKTGGGMAIVWANQVADGLRHIEKTIPPALVDPLTDVGDVVSGLLDRWNDWVTSMTAGDVTKRVTDIRVAVSELRGHLAGAEGVATGLGVALAGALAANLPVLNRFVPAINPVVGALGGMVLASDEGRAALRGLWEQGRDTFSRLVEVVGPAVGRVADQLGGVLGRSLANLGTAALEVAEILGPVLASAVETLLPSLARVLESVTELASNALPPLAALVADVLVVGIAAAAPVLDVAAAAIGLLADNTWVLVPALSAVAAVKLADIASGWAGALGGVIGPIRDAATHFGALRAEGEGVFSAMRNAGREAGGAAGALAGVLNPAVLGVTAALTAGVAIWQAWSTNVKRVEEETRALSDALVTQGRDVLPTLASSFNEILDTRDGFDEAFSKTGIAISEVTRMVNENTGQMDEFRSRWHDAGEALEFFREQGREIPEGVRPIVEELFRLREEGVLTAHELRVNIDALTDLDQQAMGTSETITTMAERFREEAEGTKLSAEAHELLNAALNASSLDEQRDALDRLLLLYPELAEGAGLWTDELRKGAEESTRELRSLTEALEDLKGSQLDVDKATGRLTEARDRLSKSLEQNGKTFDLNTTAGARNREALTSMVDAAFKLAEEQQRLDGDGERATATLLLQAEALRQAAEEAGLTQAEIQELQEQYKLTPEQIETKIRADASQARSEVADIRRRLNETPGVSEALRSRIEAYLARGEYERAEAALNSLARRRTAEYWVEIRGGTGGIPRNGPRGMRFGAADGGIIDYFRHGGIRTGLERHVAQIAPAGAWRVWAEPETGGEAYIPLAKSKRARSLAVWEETGRRLGVNVDLLEVMRRQLTQRFADGGVTASAPASPRTGDTTLGGLVVQGNLVLEAATAREQVDELDWWARYRMGAN